MARGNTIIRNHPLFSPAHTTGSRGLSRCPRASCHAVKGAITLHTLLHRAGHMPALVISCEDKRSAGASARGRQLSKGRVVAMEREDIDCRVLCRPTQDGDVFVTQQKVNARFNMTERFEMDWQRGLTSDHHVVLPGQKGNAYPAVPRRVGYRDPGTCQHDVFWSTACHRAAATAAALDKQWWQLELCFKAIKQPLGLKTFLETSPNAIMPPIGVVLITYLILAFLRCEASLGISLQQRLRLIQINLFD